MAEALNEHDRKRGRSKEMWLFVASILVRVVF